MAQPKEYKDLLIRIKQNILVSRYNAARLANRELLLLYFKVGQLIINKISNANWGEKILATLSNDLQHEIPGLRGFSEQNLKKMRVFFQEWQPYFEFGSSMTNQIAKEVKLIKFSSSVPNQFDKIFFSIGFTHHYLILSKTKSLPQRLFYIYETSRSFWTTRVLEKHLKEKLFERKGTLPNNFHKTLPKNLGNKAVRMFKNEYLWEFINTEDEDNERQVENSIVQNIKKFIMSIGGDFAFLGNQYRLLVEGEELFIDLLFYHRKLQSLIAFELKTGKFKAEYIGKMNLYLSALDEYVKQPHENPSIGIILCKSKNDKIVEFAFRDFNKPMGISTYKTSKEIPSKYKNELPDIEELKKLL